MIFYQEKMNLCDLTTDWLFLIFDLVDLETIGSLRRVCARLLNATNKWVERQKTSLYERFIFECVNQHHNVIIQCPNFKGMNDCITKLYNNMLNQTHIIYFYNSIPMTPFLGETFQTPVVFRNKISRPWYDGTYDRSLIIRKQHLTSSDLYPFRSPRNFKIDKLVVICNTVGNNQKFDKIPIKRSHFL